MPFQPINFAAIDPQGYDALANLSAYLKGGMELGEQPAKFTSEQALREAQQEQAKQAAAKSGAEAQKLQLLVDILRGGSGGNQSLSVDSPQVSQFGESGVGVKAQMPQSIANAGSVQQQPSNDMIPGFGISRDKFRQMLLNKELLGELETPEQGRLGKFEEFKREKQYEQGLPTSKTLSAYQQRADKVQPFIDSIKKLASLSSPKSAYFDLSLKPTELAAHNRALKAAVENYLAMKGWDATAENINQAKGILERGLNEDYDAYIADLKDEAQNAAKGMYPVFNTLGRDAPDVLNTLASGKIFEDWDREKAEELRRQAMESLKKELSDQRKRRVPQYKIDDPDVVDTAKEYNITPAEVLKRLGQK